MIAVSDASPLNYLIQIGCENVLGRLFETVWVPQSVVGELQHRDAPGPVREWIGCPHSFLRIHTGKFSQESVPPRPIHRGEEDAIGLALHLNIRLVLMDDLDARHAASTAGLTPVGTLRILADAARAGLVFLEAAFESPQPNEFQGKSAPVQRTSPGDFEKRLRPVSAVTLPSAARPISRAVIL